MVKAAATDVVARRVQAPETDPQRWLMLGVVLLATFMGTLDTFIVNVAMSSGLNREIPLAARPQG